MKAIPKPPKNLKALNQAHLTDAELSDQKDKELIAEYLKELKSRSKSDDRTKVVKISPREYEGRTYTHEIRFQCGCGYIITPQVDLPQLIETLKQVCPKTP